MKKLKEITIENYDRISDFLKNDDEHSCENSFVNLLIWQKAYKNQFKLYDDCFILYSESSDNRLYRLPFCDDFVKGFNRILELNSGALPTFWAQDGLRFDKFKKLYGDKYEFIEKRDAFDYVYNRTDLSELSGKKYHSKRNHIASFSKKYNWCYEKISSANIKKVIKCSERWYELNNDKMDKYMTFEKEGVNTLLNNMDVLKVKGGAIKVNDEIVAFTLGTEINSQTFDIHIEKALPDFSQAYTVINNKFALNELSKYQYINREDDMGIEGLRKAKLSYKPDFMIKKYICKPRG